MGGGASKKKAANDMAVPEPWELLTYVPPYGGDFDYSHTHFLYTNDIHRLEDIPPPHTAPTRKNEICDVESFSELDEKTDALHGAGLEKPLTELVRSICGDYDSDISKVRALYRWFTAQPVETTDYRKGANSNTGMYQLWHLKHKRNTYAAFFALLCWYAGLPCGIIRGYLKGSTYEVGQKINKDIHRGEWNAVLVDGNWRLVNAFWGACVLAGDTHEDYWYTCDENFFLTDPQQLIYTHFPEEPAWQLIDNKKTIKEFETMVFLKDRFFNLEMRVLTHPYCNCETKDGEVEVLFGLHPDKSVNHMFMCIPTVFDASGNKSKPVELPQKNVQLDFIHRPNEHVLSVKVRFPAIGTYKLEIVGKDTTVTTPDYDFDWVAIYKVNVKSVPEKMTFFPVLEPAGWGPGNLLDEYGIVALSHQSGLIKMEPGLLEVKFKIVNNQKAENANLAFKMIPMGEDEEEPGIKPVGFTRTADVLEGTVMVDVGEFKMKISHTFGDGHERNICNYHVVCAARAETPKVFERQATPPPDETDDLREKLREAIEKQDLELLERAVDVVESRGYAVTLQAELREAKDLIARLRRLQKLIHEVMTLNQRTISELRSYAHPVAEIHLVMRATLLLLGNVLDETKDWKNVQALIGKTGKQSLKRRIQELDVNNLRGEYVQSAQALVKDIRLEDVIVISAGAATFFSWLEYVLANWSALQRNN